MAWWTIACGSYTSTPLSEQLLVGSKDAGQPEANSLARWRVLLLHPALLSHQPQRETSRAGRADGGEWRMGGQRGLGSALSLRCQAVRRRQRSAPRMSFPGCMAWAGEKQRLGYRWMVQSSQERARLGDGRPPGHRISVRCWQLGHCFGFVCASPFPSATCQRHTETSPSFATGGRLLKGVPFQGQL